MKRQTYEYEAPLWRHLAGTGPNVQQMGDLERFHVAIYSFYASAQINIT